MIHFTFLFSTLCEIYQISGLEFNTSQPVKFIFGISKKITDHFNFTKTRHLYMLVSYNKYMLQSSWVRVVIIKYNEISVHIWLDWNWPTGSELGKTMTIPKKKITQKMMKSLRSLAYPRDSLTFHIYANEDNNSRRTIWPKKRGKLSKPQPNHNST